MTEEQGNAPEAARLNQITAVTREDKVCVDLTADDDADAEEDRNTSSSNNALPRTMLDPAMQMKIYIDPTSIRRVTLLSEPTPTPLSARDTPGVQIARGCTSCVGGSKGHSVMAEAYQPSCTDATSGAQAQAHEPTKRKRRKRNRKKSYVPTHEVMVITCESVEEHKERPGS